MWKKNFLKSVQSEEKEKHVLFYTEGHAGTKNYHLFATNFSWTQISIKSENVNWTFLVEIDVKILHKLQHTCTIYRDKIDDKLKFRNLKSNNTALINKSIFGEVN